MRFFTFDRAGGAGAPAYRCSSHSLGVWCGCGFGAAGGFGGACFGCFGAGLGAGFEGRRSFFFVETVDQPSDMVAASSLERQRGRPG